MFSIFTCLQMEISFAPGWIIHRVLLIHDLDFSNDLGTFGVMLFRWDLGLYVDFVNIWDFGDYWNRMNAFCCGRPWIFVDQRVDICRMNIDPQRHLYHNFWKLGILIYIERGFECINGLIFWAKIILDYLWAP